MSAVFRIAGLAHYCVGNRSLDNDRWGLGGIAPPDGEVDRRASAETENGKHCSLRSARFRSTHSRPRYFFPPHERYPHRGRAGAMLDPTGPKVSRCREVLAVLWLHEGPRPASSQHQRANPATSKLRVRSPELVTHLLHQDPSSTPRPSPRRPLLRATRQPRTPLTSG